MTFKSVKGTRDFTPEYMAERQRLFDNFNSIAYSYGFKTVETPALEELSLLTAKSGEEIESQIFIMEKRSNEKIGLRFDMTVPITRMFIEKQKEITKPVKWSYSTRMWRYEAPQKGRLREFYQMGVELFGSDKIQSDAEVISLAIDTLISFGLKSSDFVVKINNRELIEGIFLSIGIKEDLIEKVIRAIDKKSKITEEDFEKELSFLEKSQIRKVKDFLEISNLEEINENFPEMNDLAKKGFEDLEKLFSLFKIINKDSFIDFCPPVARGLAYYTGTVFECFDREGKFRAIFGGGRYDKMVEIFGGQPTPATGFAMGDVVIEFFLREKGLWKEEKEMLDYYIAPVNNSYIEKAFLLCDILRKKGKKVEMDLLDRKLGKQFAYAEKLCNKVLVIGDEFNQGNVILKDLILKEEKTVNIDEV
jgi:histidyl-tRNA synthetase